MRERILHIAIDTYENEDVSYNRQKMMMMLLSLDALSASVKLLQRSYFLPKRKRDYDNVSVHFFDALSEGQT